MAKPLIPQPENPLPAPCCMDPANCTRHPQRSKVSASGKLNRFGELCTGKNCEPHLSLQYRSLWDKQASDLAAGKTPDIKSSKRRKRRSRGLGDTVANAIQFASGGRVKPCGGCKKRQANLNHYFPYGDPPPVEPLPLLSPVRNLVMHIFPVANSGVWQANVRQIVQRMDLFNGKRIISVATEPRNRRSKYVLDSVDDVLDEFGNVRIDDVVTAPNNERRAEQTFFVPAMELVESQDPNEVTFRCHAKGVTHSNNDELPVHLWTRTMYELNLDHWDLVHEQLRQFAMTGAFRHYGKIGKAKWYYSGSFYWFRHWDVFRRNWRHITKSYHGTECWPGTHFTPEETGCLFNDHCGRLYLWRYWNKTVLPRYEDWKVERAAAQSKLPKPSPAVETIREPPAFDVTLITPTGNRPDAFALCERWMSRQTFSGSVQWIVVDDGMIPTEVTDDQEHLEYIRRPPRKPKVHTLAANLSAALPRVRGRCVLIIEDDEWYSPDYVKTMVTLLNDYELVGEHPARYYFVRHRRFRIFPEHKHCSLCRTGIRADRLNDISQAMDGNDPSIDMRLWARFEGTRHQLRTVQPLTIGFKGMPGRQGGGGSPGSGISDEDLQQLREWIGDEDLECYRKFLKFVPSTSLSIRPSSEAMTASATRR